MSFPSDLEIARGANLLPLTDIAADAGIPADCLEPYGEGAAKIKLCAVEQIHWRGGCGTPRFRFVGKTSQRDKNWRYC